MGHFGSRTLAALLDPFMTVLQPKMLPHNLPSWLLWFTPGSDLHLGRVGQLSQPPPAFSACFPLQALPFINLVHI